MIWILIIAALAMLLYYFRNEIKAYLNREVARNQELNYTDDEIEVYMAQYSSYTSKDLVRLSKGNTLSEKELFAIQKILKQRQMFP